ncbi:hypothetical protein M0805_006859 [Coniferiporia weirii]|nr:hypothetical protein M0805_006859 [Coniferiporia weirii]
MAAPIQDAIVLFGDSITEQSWVSGGVAQRLADAYARKFDVINRGFGGYNTDWAIPVLEQCLTRQGERGLAPKVRLLTIWFGANDAVLPSFFQHVPLARFGENLTRLIHMVSAPTSAWYSPETKVVLITPPPVNMQQRCTEPSSVPDRAFGVTAEYAEAVRRVGATEQVPVIDAWRALWDAAGHKEEALSRYLSDGLHLTADGYAVVYKELIKTIQDKLPELHYNSLEYVFVRYGEIDVANPRTSLVKRDIIP